MNAPAGHRDVVEILGVEVSALPFARVVATIETWIAERRPSYVCVTGSHGLMECRRNPDLRAVHNRAGLVVPDGVPLVWFSWLSGRRDAERVYGPDLMGRLTALSPMKGYRHFYYGGAEGVAERLKAALQAQHPGLQVVGTYTPPFRPLTPDEDSAMVAAINAARPDIVWVGLSTPKQEAWMASHRELLDAPVLVGVGAAFDFLSGAKQQAPRWMQRTGLEWFFRLCAEPRRLWRRYIRIVPGFLFFASQQIVATRLAPRIGSAFAHRTQVRGR